MTPPYASLVVPGSQPPTWIVEAATQNPARPRTRWYPLGPLMVAAGVTSMAELRAACPMNGEQYRRVIDHGLSEVQADRWAVKLGLHPGEVWPEWIDHATLADLVECADERCREPFVPSRPGHRFHTDQCRKRAHDREWRARRREDPEFAARDAERLAAYRASDRAKVVARRKRRIYYRANRDRELERQRRYDARVRAARRGAVA